MSQIKVVRSSFIPQGTMIYFGGEKFVFRPVKNRPRSLEYMRDVRLVERKDVRESADYARLRGLGGVIFGFVRLAQELAKIIPLGLNVPSGAKAGVKVTFKGGKYFVGITDVAGYSELLDAWIAQKENTKVNTQT